MSHTPGPWAWKGFDYADDPWLSGYNALVLCTDGRWTVTEDDACLIAAAPDLLDAAVRALPFLADHVALTLDEGPGYRIAHDQLSAAIDKALGKGDKETK